MPKYLTRREVARRLGRHLEYVNGAIDALKIASIEVGAANCIDSKDFAKLSRLTRRQPIEPEPSAL